MDGYVDGWDGLDGWIEGVCLLIFAMHCGGCAFPPSRQGLGGEREGAICSIHGMRMVC